MRNIHKKIVSFAIMLALIFSSVLTLGNVVKAEGSTTKVNVIKIHVKDESQFNVKDHDGKQINTTELETKFGKGYELIKGVTFKAFKVESAETYKKMTETPADYDTVDKVKKALSLEDDKSNDSTIFDKTTEEGGKATFNLPDGNYWFVESAKPVGYKDAKAVPFGLVLPLNNSEGRMNELYLYPKNTIESPFDPTDSTNPGLKKAVVDNDTKKEVNTTSVDLGEEHTWVVSAKVPNEATTLKKLELRENLHKALDFISGSLEVKVGETVLDKEDYKVTEPTNDSRRLSVDFTDKGIAKLTKPGELIKVSYKTTLNDKAVMGSAIYNGIQVVYGNVPGGDHTTEIPPDPNKPPHGPEPFPTPKPDTPNPTPTPPEPVTPPDNPVLPTPDPDPNKPTPPYVKVGGKVFVKQDKNDESKKLDKAEFGIVKVKGGKLLVLTEETTNKFSWTELSGLTEADKNDNEKIGKAIATVGKFKKLVSENGGKFEIKGIAFGKYYLVETKVPEGYGLPSNTVEFTVDATSYYKTLEGTSATSEATADSMPINNQKYIIPQTGGIGAIIFVVVGIAIMLTAGVLLLRKKKEI